MLRAATLELYTYRCFPSRGTFRESLSRCRYHGPSAEAAEIAWQLSLAISNNLLVYGAKDAARNVAQEQERKTVGTAR